MFKRLTKTYSENVPASLSLSHPWPSSEGTHVISCMCALPEIFVLASRTTFLASFVCMEDRVFESYSSAYQLSHLKLTCFLCNRQADDHQNWLKVQLIFPRDEKENRGKSC